MGSLKSGLCAVAFASLLGTAAVVGCSADGATDPIGDGTPVAPVPTTDETFPPGPNLPPPSSTGETDASELPPEDAGKTDARKDATPVEASVDAGPPPPVPGTACTTANEIVKKKCGACGTAETICIDAGSGLKWTQYGPCGNEVVNGCVPGTTVTEDCGNCGKVMKTCTQFCAYTSGTCTGQPANSCKPGTVEYASAGCDPQKYRNRKCGTMCTWGNYTVACEAPQNENKLTLKTTGGEIVAGLVEGDYTLSADQVGVRVSGDGDCPNAMLSTTTDHPYVVVEIVNPSATKTAKVSAWLTGPVAIDALMAVYNTNVVPVTDAQKRACSIGVNDYCPSTLPCSGAIAWPGLTGTQQITIGPKKSVLIWFQSWYGLSSTEPTTGAAKLSVRTDSVL